MLSVGPSVDFFLLLILWKLRHIIFVFCWNFCWKLKSNLGPLLVKCAGATSCPPTVRPRRFTSISWRRGRRKLCPESLASQTWICTISSGANSFCPYPPKNSFRSPPVLPSTRRSMKKSHSCSTPEIRCYNCVNNGYGSKKFMIYLISTRYLYLATLPLPCFPYVVSF